MTTTVQLVLLTVVLLSCVQTGITQCDVAMIREAVLEVLQPFMNETRAGLKAVRRDLEEHKTLTTSEMMGDAVLKKLLPYMNRIEENLSDRVDESVSSLAGDLEEVNEKVCNLTKSVEMQLPIMRSGLTSLTETMATLNAIDSKLDQLDSKQDELDMKVMSVNSELESTILTNVTRQLRKTSGVSSLGSCGGEGWRRVVYLNMTDPNTDCPSGWQLNTMDSTRTCGKLITGSLTCDSVIFPVGGGAYTSVCGRVRAYQDHITDAFEAFDDELVTTIDGAYVSGVSLTHGSPRQHIWTFAAGGSESEPTRNDACPCDATVDISIPPFVGGDYFCESGVNSGLVGGFHPYDPLWDGKNCTSSSTCCSFNNPPYFTKRLPNPTTDDLEVRLCRYFFSDDTPIELIELYVGFDELNMKELEHNTLTSLTKELQKISDNLHEDLIIHEHNVLTNVTKQLHNLAGYDDLHICGGTGGWRRVAYLDMTDPNTNCPSGWQLTRFSTRTCDRVRNNTAHTCDSVFFPVGGGAYTSVCGTIKGYQYDVTTAFKIDRDNSRVATIDDAYVSGVSLTHGTPRQHIWTFAAGAHENHTTLDLSCPCDTTINITIPEYVGEDYFCESGTNSRLRSANVFKPDDPLWDGKNCTSSSTCCSFNNPPYFIRQLCNPTTDDLEVRLCQTYLGYVGTPIEFIELYVK